MKMPLGIAMILLGAIAFHVASHGDNPGNIMEVWQSILATLENTPGPGAEVEGAAPLNGGGGELEGSLPNGGLGA